MESCMRTGREQRKDLRKQEFKGLDRAFKLESSARKGREKRKELRKEEN